jgi:hypothetical protein
MQERLPLEQVAQLPRTTLPKFGASLFNFSSPTIGELWSLDNSATRSPSEILGLSFH